MRGFPPLQIFFLGLVFGLIAWPLVRLTTNSFQGGHESHAHHDHDHGHDHAHGAADGEMQVVKGGTDHPEGEHKHVEVPTLVRLRYAHKPQKVTLSQGGRELLAVTQFDASPLELKAGLEISHDGNELILAATWPEGTPDTALTVELEPDGFETQSQTRWSSEAALEEVLTFTW